MNEFLLIFRNSPYDSSAPISPEERAAMMKPWQEWMGALQASGNLVAGQPLRSEGKVIAHDMSITDGPYIEGKEVLGGYLIVKATDLNHATEMAKGCPIYLNGGSTEVREITSM